MKTDPQSTISLSHSSHEEDGAPPQQGDTTSCAKSPQSPAQMPGDASDLRDAKVRALQQAVARGTYRVPAEQLAAKMLRDSLYEILP